MGSWKGSQLTGGPRARRKRATEDELALDGIMELDAHELGRTLGLVMDRAGMLLFMWSHRVGHDRATEQTN